MRDPPHRPDRLIVGLHDDLAGGMVRVPRWWIAASRPMLMPPEVGAAHDAVTDANDAAPADEGLADVARETEPLRPSEDALCRSGWTSCLPPLRLGRGIAQPFRGCRWIAGRPVRP